MPNSDASNSGGRKRKQIFTIQAGYRHWQELETRTIRMPTFWDTPRRHMITNMSDSHQIPSQNKTKSKLQIKKKCNKFNKMDGRSKTNIPHNNFVVRGYNYRNPQFWHVKSCRNYIQKQLGIEYGLLNRLSVSDAICVLFLNWKIVIFFQLSIVLAWFCTQSWWSNVHFHFLPLE